MDIILKGVSGALAARMSAIAAEHGISRHEMILELLADTYGEPPVVIGWVRFARRGELDADADCPECGQPLTEVWAGLLSNGTWIAPRCRGCATNE